MLQKITLTKLAAWISWSGFEINQGTGVSSDRLCGLSPLSETGVYHEAHPTDPSTVHAHDRPQDNYDGSQHVVHNSNKHTAESQCL